MSKMLLALGVSAFLPLQVFAGTYECSFVDLANDQVLKTASIDTAKLESVSFLYAQKNVEFLCASVKSSETANVDLVCGFGVPSDSSSSGSIQIKFDQPAASVSAGAQRLGLSGPVGGNAYGLSCVLRNL